MPDWEVKDMAAALEKHTAVIDGLLNQLHAEEWVAQGAPAAYIDQLKQTKQFNSYLTLSAQALGRDPAKLTAALDAFLRIEHLQSLLDSITAGVRRYQNASLADLLTAAISQNSATREKLKDYTRQLAEDREKEWEIANREAQRCRATLAKRPPAPPAKKATPAKP
ncbi:MAG: hypothetical protein HY238_24245 [Acidobacteria bacterium]|nr:hypothetical protein [Acidobacteriota bacterium]